MRRLYFLEYNHYNNRMIKKAGTTAADYIGSQTTEIIRPTESSTSSSVFPPNTAIYIPGSHYSYMDYNFNYKNGIDTEVVALMETPETSSSYSPDKINYVIVTPTDSTTIESRWYVVRNEIVSGSKRLLVLHRDVVADNWDSLMEADTMIERAKLDKTDSLIFQNEGNQYNQIKTNEVLLKQDWDGSWLVGYLNKDRTTKLGNYIEIIGTGTAAVGDIWKVVTVTSDNKEDFTNNSLLYYSSNSVYYYFIVKDFTGSQKVTSNYLLFGEFECVYVGSSAPTSTSLGYYPNNKKITAKIPGKTSYETYTSWSQLLSDNYEDESSTTDNKVYVCNSEVDLNLMFIGKNTANTIAHRCVVNNETGQEGYWKESATTSYYGYSKSSGTYGLNCWRMRDDVTATQFREYIINSAWSLKQTYRTKLEGLIADYKLLPSSGVLKSTLLNLNGKRITVGSDEYDVEFVEEAYDLAHQIPGSSDAYQYRIYDGLSSSEVAALTTTKSLITTIADDNEAIWFDSSLTYAPTNQWTETMFNGSIKCQIKTKRYVLRATKVVSGDVSATIYGTKGDSDIPQTYANGASDAEYDVIMIPYGNNLSFKVGTSGTVYEINKNSCLALASALTQKLGTSICFDVQRLPYSNINYSSTDECFILPEDVTSTNTIKSHSLIYTGSTINGFVWYPELANFRATIQLSSPITYSSLTADQFKIENETGFYRLNSPNYASSFEFKGTMNGGIDHFDINVTMRPYQPYIQINPNWGGIYGQDFNDNRGLICSGEFSMTQISDAWTEFQLQNKNFESTFDRSISSMEYSKSLALGQNIIGSATGSLTGAASGALIGGPIGAIAGGIASFAGGLADTGISLAQTNENISLQKNLHQMQLGNIQARPDTITKLSTFDINNKVYPFLEYYTATFNEKKALQDYITFNSYKVGVVGAIGEYIDNNDWMFIQGRILRIGTGDTDFDHNEEMLSSLQAELNTGVYLKIQ